MKTMPTRARIARGTETDLESKYLFQDGNATKVTRRRKSKMAIVLFSHLNLPTKTNQKGV
jgi:hypothetical protein